MQMTTLSATTRLTGKRDSFDFGCSVRGSRFAVRGSRFAVRGSRFAVRGSRFAVL